MPALEELYQCHNLGDGIQDDWRDNQQLEKQSQHCYDGIKLEQFVKGF